MLLIELMTNDEMRLELRQLSVALAQHAPGPFQRNVKFKPLEGQGVLHRFNPGMRQLDNYYSTDGEGNELLIHLVPSNQRIGAALHNANILVSAVGNMDAEHVNNFGTKEMTSKLILDVQRALNQRYDRKDDMTRFYKTSNARTIDPIAKGGTGRKEQVWEIHSPAPKHKSDD